MAYGSDPEPFVADFVSAVKVLGAGAIMQAKWTFLLAFVLS